MQSCKAQQTGDETFDDLLRGFHFIEWDLQMRAGLDLQLPTQRAPSLREIGRSRILLITLLAVQSRRFLHIVRSSSCKENVRHLQFRDIHGLVDVLLAAVAPMEDAGTDENHIVACKVIPLHCNDRLPSRCVYATKCRFKASCKDIHHKVIRGNMVRTCARMSKVAPPRRDTVFVKHLSTTSFDKPTASKICAP